MKRVSMLHLLKPSCQLIGVSIISVRVAISMVLRHRLMRHYTMSNGPHVGCFSRYYPSLTSQIGLMRCRNDTHCLSQQMHGAATSQEATEGEQTGDLSEPAVLVERELKDMSKIIHKEIYSGRPKLCTLARHYLAGDGKSFRPMVAMLMAKAVNYNNYKRSSLLESQRTLAMISEMIHAASLIHDDVIDRASVRRGKPALHKISGEKQAILTGNFILSKAAICLAKIGNEEVVRIVSQVLEDLVKGEFMQMGSKLGSTERFDHYLTKTHMKTASLIARCCKAVALLSDSTQDILDAAYEYGKNIGIAFQLIDDILDFVSANDVMGKPVQADLHLGLATGPVLFASQKYPELDTLIMRRFNAPGDVQKARNYVIESSGIQETRVLAEFHCQEAIKSISILQPCLAQTALVKLCRLVLTRTR